MHGAREIHIRRFWCGNIKRREHLEDLGVDGRIMLEWVLEKWGWVACPRFTWLRMGTSGGLF
jgi:hypothetical protein